jgi:hypothetical protein
MRSVRVALAMDVIEGVHLVQPAGHGVDHFRSLLHAYGPVSGPVLESLRLVGLRELNSEAENLVLRNGSLSGEEATIDRLPADPFRASATFAHSSIAPLVVSPASRAGAPAQ